VATSKVHLADANTTASLIKPHMLWNKTSSQNHANVPS